MTFSTYYLVLTVNNFCKSKFYRKILLDPFCVNKKLQFLFSKFFVESVKIEILWYIFFDFISSCCSWFSRLNISIYFNSRLAVYSKESKSHRIFYNYLNTGNFVLTFSLCKFPVFFIFINKLPEPS